MFKLVTQSVTSFCVTWFRNSEPLAIVIQFRREIFFKQYAGFAIYEDLPICQMKKIENFIFKISC